MSQTYNNILSTMYNHINTQTHIHINSGDTHNILTDTWTNKHNTNWTMNQIIKVCIHIQTGSWWMMSVTDNNYVVLFIHILDCFNVYIYIVDALLVSIVICLFAYLSLPPCMCIRRFQEAARWRWIIRCSDIYSHSLHLHSLGIYPNNAHTYTTKHLHTGMIRIH